MSEKYIVTLQASEVLEKYEISEMEVLEKQLKAIKIQGVVNGIFVTTTHTVHEQHEQVVTLTGLINGEILMTATCVPNEVETIAKSMYEAKELYCKSL